MTPAHPQPQQLAPRHRPAYHALLEEIAALPHGTACTRRDGGGLDWLDPRPDQQEKAAALCAGCPALQACAEYLRTNPRLPGVWAGVTEHERQSRAARYRATRAHNKAQQAGKAGQ